MRKLIIAVLAPFVEDIVAHMVDESSENLERFIEQSNKDLTEEIDNQGIEILNLQSEVSELEDEIQKLKEEIDDMKSVRGIA
jgi:peptidoglycan hydrolase CwlO-like protein